MNTRVTEARRVWMIPAALVASSQLVGAQVVRCTLSVGSYASSGPCVAERDTVRADRSRRQLAVMWPRDTVRVVITSKPSDKGPWRGVLLIPGQQVSFEIDSGRAPAARARVALRNSFSWAKVIEWKETRAPSGATLGAATLAFDLSRYVPASADDIAILERTLSRLPGRAGWDRNDDRDCANDSPGQSSLFCVLAAAVEAHMGQYHHRQPALELVRGVVGRRWPDRIQNHQLMDFNNHATTTLADLQAAVQEALALARSESSRMH